MLKYGILILKCINIEHMETMNIILHNIVEYSIDYRLIFIIIIFRIIKK